MPGLATLRAMPGDLELLPARVVSVGPAVLVMSPDNRGYLETCNRWQEPTAEVLLPNVDQIVVARPCLRYF